METHSDLLIGDFGTHVEAGDVGEFGYTIAPAFHRRGYATEAITAALAELAGVPLGEDARFAASSPARNLKRI